MYPGTPPSTPPPPGDPASRFHNLALEGMNRIAKALEEIRDELAVRNVDDYDLPGLVAAFKEAWAAKDRELGAEYRDSDESGLRTMAGLLAVFKKMSSEEEI